MSVEVIDIELDTLKQEFMETVHDTKYLLAENKEWQARFSGYANKISGNLDRVRTVRSSFRSWQPLHVYLNTTAATKATTSVTFSLRYLGQTVAELTGDTNGNRLSTKGYEKNNLKHFGCDRTLDHADWRSIEATNFRKFFSDRHVFRFNADGRGNEEHRLESLWLTELSKGSDKKLCNVRPVEIENTRFPMPTPIGASKPRKLMYSGSSGGGIDILARIGTGGRNTHLCVLELKKENVRSTQPKDSLKQGIAYASFMRELLRSESGLQWWKLFGFGGSIPESLVLYVACMMPSSSFNDYSFRDMQLGVDGDIFKLHYVYFVEEDNDIREVDTSLEW